MVSKSNSEYAFSFNANFLSKTTGALLVFNTLKAFGLIFFKFALSSLTDKFKKGSGSLRKSQTYPQDA